MKGLVTAAALMLLPTTVLAQPKEQAAPPQRQEGRYVIVHSPWARMDTMLIDTVTGRVWELVKYTNLNDEPLAWSPVPRLDTAADRQALINAKGFKDEPKGASK